MEEAFFDYPITDDEPERVKAVRSYAAFGSLSEPAYDDLTDLAAQITASPIAFVNIIDEAKGWLKAKHGLPSELTDVPRGLCVARTQSAAALSSSCPTYQRIFDSRTCHSSGATRS